MAFRVPACADIEAMYSAWLMLDLDSAFSYSHQRLEDLFVTTIVILMIA
jgi:hypothetical protein